MYLFYVLTIYFFSVIFPGDCVYYPPSFVYQPNKDEVYQNLEALMLRCVATGNPTPTYQWKKNEKIFDFSINVGRYTKWPNEGTLIFALPNDDDDGIYQCIASNDHGKAFSVKANVRRAEIQDFKSKGIEKITKNQGLSAVLKCQVPVSYPPPIVAWLKTSNGITVLLKESNKYVLDIDGNLYITSVGMDDNKAIFTCTAFNQRMRIRKTDHNIEMTVIPSQSKRKIEELFRTLQPITGRVGEKLILRCILGGNPAPTYKWTIKGQNKNILERPNFSTDAGGAILIINPVTIADQDTYQCIGENDVTPKPVIYDFAVTVEMVPQLTIRLVDANVPYNGSYQFRCEATGIPEPKISWTVNGQGLDTYLNGKNKRKSGNIIILTNLTPDDKAVFQCNASNSIGYDYSNGYINVLKDKPEFIVGPQPTLVTAENTAVTITCQSFSAPKAVVTWTKDGFPINGGRYLIQDNGDLLINKLITADSGQYACTCTNLYGSINASSSLFVRQRTELMIRPINTWVYFGQEVKFVCTAKTDRLENHNLKIIWYKDGSLITTAWSERTNVNLQDNSLIIMGAQTTDTGIYTCNATNGLDFDVAYATLIVQGKPFTPIGITADCSTLASRNLARIAWNPGADNYAPIINYLIEYSTQYDPYGWYEIQMASNITGGNGESVNVDVIMMPHINYKFRVRAMNRVGVSEPSDPTMKNCQLPPTIPQSNPSEVYVYGTTKDNLVVQWTPMTYVEHCGPKLGYEISVTCLTCMSIPKDVTNTTFVSDWDQNIMTYFTLQLALTIYPMESFQKFKVAIRAKNEIGYSKSPDTIAFGYSGDAPPALSEDRLAISAGAPSKGYVPLTWTVLTTQQIANELKGFFRGYRIEWCLDSLTSPDCDQNAQYQDVILQTQKIPVLFGNKRRKRSTNEEESDEDDIHKHDTKHRHVIPNVPSTPVNFQVLSRRKRAVLNNPDDWNYGTNITVKLQMVPGNTKIKIWLRALNAIYTSKRGNVLTVTTFEDTPGPVLGFKVVVLGINHVDLQWTSPIETNGVITGYRLAWREIKGLELGYMTTYPDIKNPLTVQFQMSGLKPETRYRVLIWALTSQGSGVESFIDIQTQPAYIAPNAPEFSVNSVVNNTVNITFAPSATGVKGSVFYAQYRKVGQYRWDESEPQYIRTWIYIENLANDTVYEIRVMATNGAGMATPSITGTFRTKGKLDPTRPVGYNAIWIIFVVIILILLILLFIFVLWYRERNMEKMIKPSGETTHPYGQPKMYDPAKQPLVSPSEMGSSLYGGPVNTELRNEDFSNEESVVNSNGSEPLGPLIEDENIPPVAYHQNPRIKKHKSKQPRQFQDTSEEENDDVII